MTNCSKHIKILLLSLGLLLLALSCGKEPQTFDENLKAGQKAFLDQDFSTARKYLSKAVTLNPSDRNALYFLGISFERDYIYDSAHFYLKRADLLFPNDREINKEIYKVSVPLSEWRDAIKSIMVLVATGDNLEDYYDELADLNMQQKNYPVAYAWYQRLKERDPNNPNWYLQEANLAVELDSTDLAIAKIDSAIARFGPRDELLMNKGNYLSGRGRHGEAEKIFRKLYESDTTSVAYRINLANSLAAQSSRKKKEEALKMYRDLSDETSSSFRIDSLITEMEKELGQ